MTKTLPTTAPQRCNLDHCPPGAPAVVAAVERVDRLGDRLAELGLTPGAAVEVVRRAPFGGPLVVRVRDYLLSLRRGEAAAVAVFVVAPAN